MTDGRKITRCGLRKSFYYQVDKKSKSENKTGEKNNQELVRQPEEIENRRKAVV